MHTRKQLLTRENSELVLDKQESTSSFSNGNGRGFAFKKVFEKAVKFLLEESNFTIDGARQWREDLKADISEIG